MDQNSQNIVLINNSRTTWPTKISMLFLSSLDTTTRCIYFKKVLIILSQSTKRLFLVRGVVKLAKCIVQNIVSFLKSCVFGDTNTTDIIIIEYLAITRLWQLPGFRDNPAFTKPKFCSNAYYFWKTDKLTQVTAILTTRASPPPPPPKKGTHPVNCSSSMHGDHDYRDSNYYNESCLYFYLVSCLLVGCF